MPPIAAIAAIVTAITGITGIAATIIAGVVSVAIDIGISLLVGAIAQALTPQPGLKSTLTVSLNANDPRRIIVGRAATAGALVSFQSYGNNNEWMILIFRVADHLVQGFAPQINITGNLTTGSATVTGVSSTAGITVGMPIVSFASGQRFPPGTWVEAIPSSSTLVMSNEATATLTATPIVVNCSVYWNGNPVQLGAGGAVPQFHVDGRDNCWVTLATGDWNQAADPDMVANSGGRWDANSRGRGVAYVKVKAYADLKAFPNGIEQLFQFVYVIDGISLYDRRQDSSVGGSGSQRWNDTSTWSFNNNSAVVAENLLRGIRVEDTSAPVGSRAIDTFYGLDLTDADLPFAEQTAAMNACDTAFPLLAGGTEPAYRCNGVIAPNFGDSFETGFTDVMATMGAKFVQSPARYFFLPAVAQTSVRSFTDADFRLDGPSKLVNDIALDTIANAVMGQFADPASMYSGAPLPTRYSIADATADGGGKVSTKVTTLDLSYVTSETQGQRLQEILRRRQRLQHSGQRALAPENLDLEAGDWWTWTSARFGWTKTFEIVQSDGKGSADEEQAMMIVIDFAETSSSLFTWTPSVDELSRQAPKFLPSADPTGVAVTTLTAAATTIADPNGGLDPAIAVTRDALTDPTVVAVVYNYWAWNGSAQVGPTLTKQFAVDPNAESGTQSATLSDGVVDGYFYRVEAAAVQNPPQVLSFAGPATTSAVTQSMTTSNGLPINLPVGGYSFNPPAPLSSPSSTSISVAATTLTLTGQTLSLPSGTITGLTASTLYAVFYDLQASAYVAVAAGSAAAQLTSTTRYVSMGAQLTEMTGGGFSSPPAPPGGGGGGHLIY